MKKLDGVFDFVNFGFSLIDSVYFFCFMRSLEYTYNNILNQDKMGNNISEN